jgi:hypothetical protein
MAATLRAARPRPPRPQEGNPDQRGGNLLLKKEVRVFIVHHYRFDAERRERRHVAVAVFDNEPEFLACIERVRAGIERRREAGEPVDPREYATGVVHEPGYLRRAANGHLAMRAVAHGAGGPWLEELELPSNISVRR